MILDLSDRLLLSVIRKVDAVTFSHLLRSCKPLTNFAFKNVMQLNISLKKHFLQIMFDLEEEKKTCEEYEIQCTTRKSVSFDGDRQFGFNVTTSKVMKFQDFLEYLPGFGFFDFEGIFLCEELKTTEAKNAVIRTLIKMKELNMKTKELEMWTTEICNQAIDVLRPSYFRCDFQEGQNLSKCITRSSLKKLKCLDYYSPNDEDAQETIKEVLPNCLYMDICFDFKCPWIWVKIFEVIESIRRKSVINHRLSLSVFETDIPVFSTYFKYLPHKIFKKVEEDDHFIISSFIETTDKLSFLVVLTRSNVLGEAFHYNMVDTFKEFQEFYCESMKKKEYDFNPEIKKEIFGIDDC